MTHSIDRGDTQIWFTSSGQITAIEMYSTVTEEWIPIHIHVGSVNLSYKTIRRLLDKSQVLVDKWLSENQDALEPDGAA